MNNYFAQSSTRKKQKNALMMIIMVGSILFNDKEVFLIKVNRVKLLIRSLPLNRDEFLSFGFVVNATSLFNMIHYFSSLNYKKTCYERSTRR